MNCFDIRLLKEISSIYSPSSYEYGFQGHFADILRVWGYDVRVDSCGNLFTEPSQGGKPSVLIMAHADHVALQVKEITDGGFLKFRKIGGIDIHSFYGQDVVVLGKDGIVPGIIGRNPRDVNESESGFTINTKSMWIDIGASSIEEASRLVEVNDMALFRSNVTALGHDKFAMAAADDKLGVYCLLRLAEMLSAEREKSPFDICFALSAQEEIGCRGSKALAMRLKPAYAIILDVEYASDYPGGNGDIRLGGGPVLTDNADNNPRLVDMARKTGVTHQYAFTSEFCGCTDAESFITNSPDTAVINIGIPLRNMHSAREVFDAGDLELTQRMAVSLIQSIISKNGQN